MEYVIIPIVIMAPIIIYLYLELLKSKAQRKQIQKELEESRKLRTIVTDKGLIPIPKKIDPRRDQLEKINEREREGKQFRDLLDRASKESGSSKYDVWYGDNTQCPPLGKSCPMMFYCIPAGQSAVCSACNKTVRSSSPMF